MRTGKVSKKVGQREQLILALLQQPSLEKAAASIGISTVTAWRISKTRELKEEYRNARWEAFSQSLARPSASFGRSRLGSSQSDDRQDHSGGEPGARRRPCLGSRQQGHGARRH